MKRSDAFPRQYRQSSEVLSAPGGKVTDTIEFVTLEEMPSKDGRPAQKKPVVYFRTGKPFVLNQVNWTTLEEKLGEDTDNWTGARVRLCVQKVQFGGKMVDGIRFDAVARPDQTQ